MRNEVSLGIAGIGGFAGSIRDLIMRQGAACDPPVRLSAVCDPQPGAFPEVVSELRRQGVAVHDDYDALLAEPIEGVWLPVPIHLHRPFTEQALAAGKAVMCEKPAAGTLAEVDAMIAARDAAGRPALIGYQDMYDRQTGPIKRRLLSGEFGDIERATLHACWPRGSTYFGRNNWAGRQRVGDAWVLDSPANNALSHQINIALFYLGPALGVSAVPVAVEAELYRAADIENYDTISARVTLDTGASLLVLMTHACRDLRHPILTLHGQAARVVRHHGGNLSIHTADGVETVERAHDMRPRMLEAFSRAIRGVEPGDTPLATLETARSHTMLINAISEAAPIISAPEDAVESFDDDEQNGLIRCIRGIEDAFKDLAEADQMMHESGRFGFTVPPQRLDMTGYCRFAGPCGFEPHAV